MFVAPLGLAVVELDITISMEGGQGRKGILQQQPIEWESKGPTLAVPGDPRPLEVLHETGGQALGLVPGCLYFSSWNRRETGSPSLPIKLWALLVRMCMVSGT